MKKTILILIGFFFWGISWAQVGINTQNPQGVFHINTQNTLEDIDDIVVHKDGNVSIGFTLNQSKLAVNGDVALGENIPGKMGYGSKLYFEGVKHINDIWMAKYNVAPDSTELRINIGIENGGTNRFEVGRLANEDRRWHTSWYVSTTGISRIGNPFLSSRLTSNNYYPNSLIVSGKIWASDNIILDKNTIKSKKVLKKENDLANFCRTLSNTHFENQTEDEIELGVLTNILARDIEDLMQYTIETYNLLQNRISIQQKLKADIYNIKNHNSKN